MGKGNINKTCGLRQMRDAQTKSSERRLAVHDDDEIVKFNNNLEQFHKTKIFLLDSALQKNFADIITEYFNLIALEFT